MSLTPLTENTRQNRHGFVAFRCPACNDARCGAVTSAQNRIMLLFVVPITPWMHLSRYVRCSCGWITYVGPKEFRDTSPIPGDPLDLIESTNPSLTGELLLVEVRRERLKQCRLTPEDRSAWIEDAIRSASRALPPRSGIATRLLAWMVNVCLFLLLFLLSWVVLRTTVPALRNVWPITLVIVIPALMWLIGRFFRRAFRAKEYQFAGIAMSDIAPTPEEIAVAAAALRRQGVELCRHISPDDFAKRVMRGVQSQSAR